jgi:hypothetical protein
VTIESRRLDRGLKELQTSTTHAWVACLIASRIVGKRDGTTALYAEKWMKSPSQIENYARAGLGYRAFRRHLRIENVKALYPSHFTAAYTSWLRYEFDPQVAATYLTMAAMSGWSSRDMEEFIGAENFVPKDFTLGDRWWEKGWKAIEESQLDAGKRNEALSLFREFREVMRG